MAKSKEPGEQASVDDATLEAVQIDAPKVPAVLDPDDPWGLLPLSALGDDLAVTFMDFQQGFPGPGEADLVELGFSLRVRLLIWSMKGGIRPAIPLIFRKH